MQLPVWFKVTHTAVPLQSAQHIAPQQRLNALQWPIVAEPQMKDRLKRGFWRLIKALDMFVLCLLCSFSYNKSQRHFPYTGKPSRTTQWTPPLADVPAQCVCVCCAVCFPQLSVDRCERERARARGRRSQPGDASVAGACHGDESVCCIMGLLYVLFCEPSQTANRC